MGGRRTISLSEEAYERLKAEKKEHESFTDVVNRLTRKCSLLELSGILSKREGEEVRKAVASIRAKSRNRLTRVTKNSS